MYKNGEVHNVKNLSDHAVPCKIVGVVGLDYDKHKVESYFVQPLEKIGEFECDCTFAMDYDISPVEMYQCQYCGKFIEEDKGVTCHGGEWTCDEDSCSTYNAEYSERYIRRD